MSSRLYVYGYIFLFPLSALELFSFHYYSRALLQGVQHYFWCCLIGSASGKERSKWTDRVLPTVGCGIDQCIYTKVLVYSCLHCKIFLDRKCLFSARSSSLPGGLNYLFPLKNLPSRLFKWCQVLIAKSFFGEGQVRSGFIIFMEVEPDLEGGHGGARLSVFEYLDLDVLSNEEFCQSPMINHKRSVKHTMKLVNKSPNHRPDSEIRKLDPVRLEMERCETELAWL